MCDQRVNFGRTFFLEQLGCTRNGVGGICEVVDEDRGAIGNVADEHHGSILAVGDFCGATFLRLKSVCMSWGIRMATDLVDEGEADAE